MTTRPRFRSPAEKGLPMRPILLAALLLPAAALAHPGGHPHPHGVDASLVLALAGLAAMAAAAALLGRRG